jgi:putative endonuclease
MKNTTARGQECERIAEAHYRALGFQTVERNFRAKTGEIDLILRQGGLLLFVEVKGRRANWEQHAWLPNWGPKLKRMHATIRLYLQEKGGPPPAEQRIEIVFVTHGRVAARIEGI